MIAYCPMGHKDGRVQANHARRQPRNSAGRTRCGEDESATDRVQSPPAGMGIASRMRGGQPPRFAVKVGVAGKGLSRSGEKRSIFVRNKLLGFEGAAWMAIIAGSLSGFAGLMGAPEQVKAPDERIHSRDDAIGHTLPAS